MAAVAQPSGTVTLVFTDIEGSTRLLDELGVDAYREALAEHRRVVREACARHNGYEVDYEGDAFFYAFGSATAAVNAVSEAMSGLDGGPIRIRVGIHTGEPALDPPKYVGIDVHRAARIMSAAHGGQVVLSPTTVALLEPAAVQLKELGQHRLKDLSAPIPLHQLVTDGLPTEFPPLKTLYRSNLPVPATPFRGRARELGEVVALVTREDVRLVTLTGPGGTGKTRLALQAAAEAADHHPDGIVWVPLASVRDPSRVLAELADALGVKADPGLTLVETLTAGLAGRRPLLVVDNAEHLLPELAGALTEFRVAVPTATVLVTSRERLQLDGEHAWAVPSLDGREGVGLFLERARAVGVELEETEVVEQLCAQLDQLPLALELAAARTLLFGPEQLLERLDQRLDLFAGGRDIDPRQQTLRATIAWSHDLLDEPEQRLFRRLAVFVGGCTYEAAEDVAGAGPDILQSLLDKSLLRRDAGTDAPRYWMLETIREYALERLAEAGEGEGAEQRHFDYFARLVHEADAALMGPAQQRWLAILDAEAANWRLALRRELDVGDADRAAGMAADLTFYWWFRGRAEEGTPLLAACLASVIGDRATRARVLAGAGDLASYLDDREHEHRYLTEALAIFEELGDRESVALTHASLAWWASSVGDAASATRSAELALDASEATQRPWVRGYALLAVGRAAADRGDLDEAGRIMRDLDLVARESGNPRMLVMALTSLGWHEIRTGNYEAARAPLLEALALVDPDDRELVQNCLANLGWIELSLGRTATAATRFRESLVAAPPGNRLMPAEALFGVAALAAATRPETATRLWSAAVALFESCGMQREPVLERVEESMLAPLRAVVDEAEFDRLWDAGRSLPVPAAIDLAIDEANALGGESEAS